MAAQALPSSLRPRGSAGLSRSTVDVEVVEPERAGLFDFVVVVERIEPAIEGFGISAVDVKSAEEPWLGVTIGLHIEVVPVVAKVEFNLIQGSAQGGASAEEFDVFDLEPAFEGFVPVALAQC